MVQRSKEPGGKAAAGKAAGENKQLPKNPGRPGRPAGSPNKVTQEFRETVKKLLEDNSANVGIWLAQVAEGHGETKPAPEKALDLLVKLAEFAAPKLARHEHTGKDGGPMVVSASPVDARL